MATRKKPNLTAVESDDASDAWKAEQAATPAADETEPQTVEKPTGKFDLSKFKSTRGAAVSSVDIQPGVLSIHSMAEAKDFVRLHPTEWSDELCWIKVPIKGDARESLHLIEEELAEQYLRQKQIVRFRVALASKPFDIFFLCIVPTCNLDNTWAASNLACCEKAKTLWTEAVSLKDQGKDSYEPVHAGSANAFPDPKWPKQNVYELLEATLRPSDRMIGRVNHPALDRKRGIKSEV
jgi:hypothetical protein